MKRILYGFILLTLVLALLPTAASAQTGAKPWPTLSQQLSQDRVPAGSALERLIAANQNFRMLRPGERDDSLRVPLWLRVLWRKNHPELVYDRKDATGGYPLVLKEVHEWMITHPDLKPVKADTTPTFDFMKAATNEQRISGPAGNPRSESDIRVNYANPQLIISASNNIGGNGSQAQYFSSNGGATWGQGFLPKIAGDAFHSDPTVDWTSDGTAWSTTIGINSGGSVLQMRSYKSTNNGATWTFDDTFSDAQNSADKQIMWVDHSSTSPFKDNIYVIWHNGTPAYISRRDPSSGVWSAPVQVSDGESTGTAIGADVKTNSFGDAFGFWPTTGNRRIVMVKSTNGGGSWGAGQVIANTFDSFDIGVPSFNSRRILIYVSGGAYRTASKNLVYAAWTDLSGATGCTSSANEPGSNVNSNCKSRIWFTRSTNGGSTWEAPRKINDQAGRNDQFNQWLVVDETDGTLAIMYYDTVADAGRKKTHVYLQTSTNDGVSWGAAQQVTTAPTDETAAGSDSGNQYGDYNSLSGIAGVFFPSWTDRRSGASEEIWTAAVSDNAPCTPLAAPTGLAATAVSSSQIDLTWNAVTGASDYRILRSTTSGGPFAQVGVSTTTSFSNTGLAPSTTYFYVVRSFSGCESGNSAQAQATTQAGSGCTVTSLYNNNFDSASGLSDWTLGAFSGNTSSWRGVQKCSAASGSNIFRFGGSRCTRNYGNNKFNFAQPKGATGIAVPAGATTARLSFAHRREFETGFDGATLALSLDNANYTLVPASAILSGATYNGTVDASCPPAGAAGIPTFTATQSTFVSTTVDLDAACNAVTGGAGGCAGQTLYIAFTTITDCTVTRDGWFLDDVSVTACVP